MQGSAYTLPAAPLSDFFHEPALRLEYKRPSILCNLHLPAADISENATAVTRQADGERRSC